MVDLILYILGFKGRRVISGPTHNGRNIKEGQEWRLTEDISHELKQGIFVVVEYYGDRILLKRKDGRHDLPSGVLPIFEIDILDNQNFKLAEREK